MESTNSVPQPPIPLTTTPIQQQQQQQPETKSTTPTPPPPPPPQQSQPIQPKQEPADQPIALQVTPTVPSIKTTASTPQSITTQSIQLGQVPVSQHPVSQEQTNTTTQQHIQLQIHQTSQDLTTSVTSQPIQLQVQPIITTLATTTPTPTTPTTIAPQLNSTTTVVATQSTPIATTQIPRGLPTIQIRPPGTTLTLTTTPSVATTPPTIATNLAVTNQQTPSATTPTIIKAESYRFICCLLDNGVKCERIAGNASFNLRIQKVVVTKKLNFELDPKVTHGYICEYHKGIITVAKKSTPIPRGDGGKANARNYNTTANNNNTALEASGGVAVAPSNNIAYSTADLSRQTGQQRGQITTLQQPVNLKLITNTNQRLSNNHHPSGVPVGTTLNSIPLVRQGTQIAYAHYQPAAAHQNQVTNMDVIMSNSNYDNTGGDNIGVNLGPSGSGIDVDLQQLQVNTLRRYKRHFRVQTRPGLNKLQLAESLKGHFRTLPIIEKEAITYFVYIVKCFRNKLDHNPKAD